MRVLVTGGAGFIGSHIVDALLAPGHHHEVIVLDALRPPLHAGPPDHLDPRAELIIGELSDAHAVRAAVDGVDAVCHQAAKVGLGHDLGDIAEYARDNDLGTAVLLKVLAEREFAGRFVLASSMLVYGEGRYSCLEHGVIAPAPRRAQDLEAGRFDPTCPLCGRPLTPAPVPESAPTEPRNVYSATKLHQEHLCAAWARATGNTVTALRYGSVYGPRMPRETPYAAVASVFRSAVEHGEAPQVFEDGCQIRDFVHVHDVARANLIALTSPEPRPGAFNVCSGTPRTVKELAEALVTAAGTGAPPPVVTARYRLGDVRHLFASPRRAREVLRFTAHEDFMAGMAEFARGPRPAAGAAA